MAYFDKAPGKSGETKEKNTVRLEDNTTSNRQVDERLLRLKMKQLVQKEFFHQIEPVEVIEVVEEPDGSGFGKIIGRYIYSEYNISKGDARANGEFIPINSNIIQMPLPGELVIGMEFNDSRYYFSALNPQPQNINNAERTKDISIDESELDKRTTLADADTEFKNISNNIKGSQKVNRQDALIQRIPEFNKQSNVNPGDTIIQGRHNNYIQLSSNQSIKRHRGLDLSTRDESGNVLIGAHRTTPASNSIIHLTTYEQPKYNERINLIGESMNKSQDGRYEMKDREKFISRFSNPSIFMKSDRIVLYAESDDIAIFSEGNIHIKGKRVQIRNDEQVNITTKSLSQQVKTAYRLKEELSSGDVVLLPDGIVERGRKLALEHRQNILNYIQKLNSLIPAAIPGTRSVVNPAWFKNIRDDIRNAKTALEQNKLIIGLKWLDFDNWKTYTMDELKEAFSPIPGMADVIGKLSNLEDLVEDVKQKKQEFEVAKAKFEEFKAIAENPAAYFENLVYSSLEALTIDDFVEMEIQVNDFIAGGGNIDNVESGPELQKGIFELRREYDAISEAPFGDQPTLRERWNDKAEKFKQRLQGGLANGFRNSVVKQEIEVDEKGALASAAEGLSEVAIASNEAQKNL